MTFVTRNDSVSAAVWRITGEGDRPMGEKPAGWPWQCGGPESGDKEKLKTMGCSRTLTRETIEVASDMPLGAFIISGHERRLNERFQSEGWESL